MRLGVFVQTPGHHVGGWLHPGALVVRWPHLALLKHIEDLGAATLSVVEQAGRTFNLLLLVLWQLVQPPYSLYPTVRQTYFIGARSMTIRCCAICLI